MCDSIVLAELHKLHIAGCLSPADLLIEPQTVYSGCSTIQLYVTLNNTEGKEVHSKKEPHQTRHLIVMEIVPAHIHRLYKHSECTKYIQMRMRYMHTLCGFLGALRACSGSMN